jgi:dTMP kinase
MEFHGKVRNGFLEMARAEPQRFRIVNATLPIEEVTLAMKNIIDQELC